MADRPAPPLPVVQKTRAPPFTGLTVLGPGPMPSQPPGPPRDPGGHSHAFLDPVRRPVRGIGAALCCTSAALDRSQIHTPTDPSPRRRGTGLSRPVHVASAFSWALRGIRPGPAMHAASGLPSPARGPRPLPAPARHRPVGGIHAAPGPGTHSAPGASSIRAAPARSTPSPTRYPRSPRRPRGTRRLPKTSGREGPPASRGSGLRGARFPTASPRLSRSFPPLPAHHGNRRSTRGERPRPAGPDPGPRHPKGAFLYRVGRWGA